MFCVVGKTFTSVRTFSRRYAVSKAPNKINLQGRVAVVTGGAQGIGLAVAQRLIDSGAKVSVWDLDNSLLEKVASQMHTVRVDITATEQVQTAVQSTLKQLGKIDILINNAGISGPNKTTWEYPVDQWRLVMEVCLNGTFYCCREVIPHMLKQNYGRIVNVASVAGKEGNPQAPAYSAAKAGVIALTKSLGKELAKTPIAVNCVTPAASPTRIFEQMTQEHINFMLSKIPRGRFVEVDEIAAMIAWLASEDNSFTTGGVFDISGGRATY